MVTEKSDAARLSPLEWKRGGLLSVTFFLIVFGILFTRPLRSALVLEYHSAAMLPILWLWTGAITFAWVVVYNRLLRLFTPEKILLGSSAFFVGVLFLIRAGFNVAPGLSSQFLYIWNDAASIIIIEQIWSLLDDYFTEPQAKRSFGPIGASGIFGGIGGAWLSTRMIEHFTTLELVGFSAWILVALLVPCAILAAEPRRDLDAKRVELVRGFKLIRDSRFLQLLAASVLLTQVMSNVIDLQFNSYVSETYRTTDERSRYLGHFLMWMNCFSAFLMLGLPVWLLRTFGIRTGLLVLPTVNSAAAVASLFGVTMAYPGAKFVDKSFNYSIQRASKEILYIPIRAEDRFQLKPILDVFFYRMSETVAAAMVIPFLKLFTWRYLGGLTAAICILQICVVFAIFRALRAYSAEVRVETSLYP